MNADAKKRYKDIDMPFICPITKREFLSVKGLAIYITKTLNFNHKDYYDKYINHRNKDCYFCGGEGKFITVGKGYRNLCDNPICLEKSFKSNSIECIRYRENCSIERAEELFKSINDSNLYKRTITRSKIVETNPNYYKENSRNCKEYWIKRGMSEQDAKDKSYSVMKDIHTKTSIIKKNNKEKYKDSYNTTIEYYTKRGYSDDVAIQMLSKRQSTFSKEKCIEKYGTHKGLSVWEKRQKVWLNTMDSKTDDEKREIIFKRLFNKGGFSKISQNLFWDIYNLFKNNNINFEELNSEIIKYDYSNKSYYKYDYVDNSNKKVIEFNGDFWHCNPNKYDPKFKHKIINKTAQEIWDKDEIKNKFIINEGYDLLIIWESEYRKNPKIILEKCLEFLKK